MLMKMIGVAVLINAVLLPILATLGVFKPKKGYTLMSVKLIKLPPLPKRKVAEKKAPPKKQVAKARARNPGRETVHHGPVRVVQNQPHVALSQSTTNTSEGVAQGTQQMGQVPTSPVSPPTQQAQPTPPPPTTPPPSVAVAPLPAPVKPAPPPPVHVPVYAAAVPVDQPQPDVPDDLRDQELHAVFRAVFTISPNGSAELSDITSTGNSELDDLAKKTASRWTFKPGTCDGIPIKSYLRIEMHFDVNT